MFYTNPQYQMGIPKMDGLSGYYGGEFHFFGGFGMTAVKCKDECGNTQTFRYMKFCIGGAIGGGGSAGLVSGMEGKACRSDTYKGWFYEAGLSVGPAAFGFDDGFQNNQYYLPIPQRSGVTEGSAGFGFGLEFKSSWCFYVPLQ